MLPAPSAYLPLDDLDHRIFQATVPAAPYLRRVKAVIDFDRFQAVRTACYSPDLGRPALEPLLVLKLEFLQYQYHLSDRQVIEQARCPMAYRYFLDLSLHSPLPPPSLLTYFRQRLGPERHQQIFDALVGQAREHGLVKDRLRLKDATHVIANVAIPRTIALVAQTRDRLLQALEPWAAADVAGQRQRVQQIQQATADLAGEERLLQRVVHLRELVAWAQGISTSAPFTDAPPAPPQPLQEALTLATKVLADRDDPDGPDQRRSVQDPDARRAKHRVFDDGSLVDVAMDADSELITALHVLPGGANEGADAATLVRQEEQAHGKDVPAVSLDGAGFQGPVLRELTAPAGLAGEVFTPPREPNSPQEIKSDQFTRSADQQTLTCPAGQTTTNRRRHTAAGWQFRFPRSACAGGPLQARCVPRLPATTGRTVFKSDYEEELQAARPKAQTPAYQQVRRDHGAIERKLGEMVRRPGARQARYRGRRRVLLQQLRTGWVVNLKRLVRLRAAAAAAPAAPVRAGLMATG